MKMTTNNATVHERHFIVIRNQLTAFSVELIRNDKFMNGSLISVAQRNQRRRYIRWEGEQM